MWERSVRIRSPSFFGSCSAEQKDKFIERAQRWPDALADLCVPCLFSGDRNGWFFDPLPPQNQPFRLPALELGAGAVPRLTY
jgi:hypothetical protein